MKQPATDEGETMATAKESGTREHLLRTLSPDECFELLEPGGIGRVGFSSVSGTMILPVNFALRKRTVVFRTAPDSLLAAYANGRVSFEADQVDEELREGWSVLVHGHAHVVTGEHDVRDLEDRTHVQPWAAGARDVYVRIVPAQITGRRI
jgi:nitroimidazol reductase NimA-like FMN-containing flavoprotein (pyridoxamine 5'-phosphate oxidase superfamily)